MGGSGHVPFPVSHQTFFLLPITPSHPPGLAVPSPHLSSSMQAIAPGTSDRPTTRLWAEGGLGVVGRGWVGGGCWVGVGCWVLGAGCWVLGWVLGATGVVMRCGAGSGLARTRMLVLKPACERMNMFTECQPLLQPRTFGAKRDKSPHSSQERGPRPWSAGPTSARAQEAPSLAPRPRQRRSPSCRATAGSTPRSPAQPRLVLRRLQVAARIVFIGGLVPLRSVVGKRTRTYRGVGG